MGVASTALLTFVATNASFSSYDAPVAKMPSNQSYERYSKGGYFTFDNKTLNSGSYSTNFKVKRSDFEVAHVEKLVAKIRSSQNDIDQNLKSLISENLWDLYA